MDELALANPDQPGQSVLEQTRVPAETSQRIACDASKVVMWHAADGSVLDVGRKTRTVPPTIRRALEYRDKHCRFPGCGSKYCDAHHIRHWARGGETKLDNLSLLCVRHHRAVHEGGFRMVRTPLKQLEFYWPNGHLMPDAPSPPPIPGDPRQRNRRASRRRRHRHRRTNWDSELGRRANGLGLGDGCAVRRLVFFRLTQLVGTCPSADYRVCLSPARGWPLRRGRDAEDTDRQEGRNAGRWSD